MGNILYFLLVEYIPYSMKHLWLFISQNCYTYILDIENLARLIVSGWGNSAEGLNRLITLYHYSKRCKIDGLSQVFIGFYPKPIVVADDERLEKIGHGYRWEPWIHWISKYFYTSNRSWHEFLNDASGSESPSESSINRSLAESSNARRNSLKTFPKHTVDFTPKAITSTGNFYRIRDLDDNDPHVWITHIYNGTRIGRALVHSIGHNEPHLQHLCSSWSAHHLSDSGMQECATISSRIDSWSANRAWCSNVSGRPIAVRRFAMATTFERKCYFKTCDSSSVKSGIYVGFLSECATNVFISGHCWDKADQYRHRGKLDPTYPNAPKISLRKSPAHHWNSHLTPLISVWFFFPY